jgi:H+-transporting ATPase
VDDKTRKNTAKTEKQKTQKKASPTARETTPKASESTPSTDDLLAKLASSSDGLTSREAEQRLAQYGYNELPEEQVNPILKFLSYFWGPIPWMIEAASAMSAAVGRWEDLGIILTLLMTNATIGFWEEYQAGNAVAALRAQLSLRALVKRDGEWKTVPARELVPGDVVRLRIGDIVPADTRLLAGEPAEVDQSSLTGESLPVTRKTGDDVYSGSIVKRGEADGMAYATGKDTYMGKTAHLVETAGTVSHFQRAVLKIGNYLIALALALVAVIVTVSILRGEGVLPTLEFALVLTVAGIPVAMPTVLSITMAVGARILARRQAIVTRLAAVEELAGVDVLCSDKTGTLTQNKLTPGTPFVIAGVDPGELMQSAALASRTEDSDAIDLAVLSGAGKLDSGYEVTQFQPFDPVSKLTEATVKAPDGSTFKTTKGAPQVILQLSANVTAVQPQVMHAVEEFAAKGFRSLGVARTDKGGNWQFLGVIPLSDPPREDAKEVIKQARALGIEVKMVTGDQIAIAKEIAGELGLGTNIVAADVLLSAVEHPTPALEEAVEDADGFAQVFPEHKYSLVKLLQRRGHIVGVTGDGVNDAPALKQADAGIAVSGASDAARAAADITLLTPGLDVIVGAIRESRKIFQRMNSYAIYRIAETVRVLLFMTLAILVFNFFPVTAFMIVLLALLNDGAILSIAYDRTRPSDTPEAWDMRQVLSIATVLGVTGVISTFGLFVLAERVLDLDRDTIRTLMYLKLSVAGHLTIFLTRTRGSFWSTPPALVLLLAVVGTQLIATTIAVSGLFMTPIGWEWALLVWGYALAWFILNDRVKLLAYAALDRRRARGAA